MNLIKHIKEFLFPETKEELYRSLTGILGFSPRSRNLGIYRQALQHKSITVRDENGHTINNERLEFLGDAIIEAVVSNYLFRKYPNRSEGFLTTARSKMVQRSTLGKLSEAIGLDALIQSSIRSDAHNSYIAGNAFEALVGAVYLDRGYRYCQSFFLRLVVKGYIDIEKLVREEQNYKSHLLEWCQKNRLTIFFESEDRGAVSEEEHQPPFIGQVYVENILLGEGRGYSKKESHQKAAEIAMGRIKSQSSLKRQLIEMHKAEQGSKENAQGEENDLENFDEET